MYGHVQGLDERFSRSERLRSDVVFTLGVVGRLNVYPSHDIVQSSLQFVQLSVQIHQFALLCNIPETGVSVKWGFVCCVRLEVEKLGLFRRERKRAKRKQMTNLLILQSNNR